MAQNFQQKLENAAKNEAKKNKGISQWFWIAGIFAFLFASLLGAWPVGLVLGGGLCWYGSRIDKAAARYNRICQNCKSSNVEHVTLEDTTHFVCKNCQRKWDEKTE